MVLKLRIVSGGWNNSLEIFFKEKVIGRLGYVEDIVLGVEKQEDEWSGKESYIFFWVGQNIYFVLDFISGKMEYVEKRVIEVQKRSEVML